MPRLNLSPHPRPASRLALLGALMGFCPIGPGVCVGDEVESSPVAVILETYCFSCHGEDTQKGDVRLDQLDTLALDARLELFNKMQEQVFLGEMPPQKKSLVNEADLLVDWYVPQDQHVFENLLGSEVFFAAPIDDAGAKIDMPNELYDHFKDTDWRNNPKFLKHSLLGAGAMGLSQRLLAVGDTAKPPTRFIFMHKGNGLFPKAMVPPTLSKPAISTSA